MLHPRNKTFACLREYKLDTYVICLKIKYLVESCLTLEASSASSQTFYFFTFTSWKLKLTFLFKFQQLKQNSFLWLTQTQSPSPLHFTCRFYSTKKFILLLFQHQNFSFKSKLNYPISDSISHLIWVSLASLDQIKE